MNFVLLLTTFHITFGSRNPGCDLKKTTNEARPRNPLMVEKISVNIPKPQKDGAVRLYIVKVDQHNPPLIRLKAPPLD